MTEKLILQEIYALPENLKMEVLHYVMFLKQENAGKKVDKPFNKRIFGISKGKYKLSSDFDAPLEDFKEYI